MSVDGFGVAKYGGGGGFKTWDLKTDKTGGTLIYTFRILPPMKSLAQEGKWALYHGTHFGYAGVDKKDSTKTKQRPFKCIEERDFRKNNMITKACPECQLVAGKKAELEAKEIQVKANIQNTEAIVKELLAEDREWLYSHNCQRQWHMNVMSPQFEFGVLRMAHEVKKLLEEKIKECKKNWGVDPTDLNSGCWFQFKRVGAKMAVQTTVELEMEQQKDATGRTTGQSLKLAPLTEEQAKQALENCPDLNDVVSVLSEQQITLLTTGSGDPEEIDNIWAMGQKSESVSAPVQAPTPKPAPVAAPKPPPAVVVAPVVAPAPVPAPAPVAAPVAPPAAPEDPRIALFRAAGLNDAQIQMMLALATPAAAPAAVAAPIVAPVAPVAPPAAVPPTPAATPAAQAGLPRERFMNLFNEKK